MVLMIAAGFTETVTVNGFPESVIPEQAPKEGITRYVAVCWKFVWLVKVPNTERPLSVMPPVSETFDTDGWFQL